MILSHVDNTSSECWLMKYFRYLEAFAPIKHFIFQCITTDMTSVRCEMHYKNVYFKILQFLITDISWYYLSTVTILVDVAIRILVY